MLTSQQSNLQTGSLQNLTLKFLGERFPFIRVDTQNKTNPPSCIVTFSLPSTTEGNVYFIWRGCNSTLANVPLTLPPALPALMSSY